MNVQAPDQLSQPTPAANGAMSWTEDRIELLRRLWQDGLSASTIAREMGGAITRNAVIGKVHRMGLAGRAKTTAQVPTRSKAKPIPGASIGGGTSVGDIMAKSSASINAGRSDVNIRPSVPMTSGNTALAMSLAPMVVPAAEPRIQAATDVVIPICARVTIMELREAMCKWPLGDPLHSNFRYCGAKAPLGGAPYCTAHSQLAYQPSQARGARDRKQLRIG